jgi:hypothetical protein
MVNSKNLIFAALLAGAAVFAAFLFFQGDEAKIKKKFHALAEQAGKNGNEHDLIAAKKAHQIEQLFFGTVRIEIPSYEIDKSFPRSEISPNVLYARARYQKISLEFYDFRFSFSGKEKAVVNLTGVLDAVLQSGEQISEIHEAACTLEKIEGEWLFTGIREVDVLEK